MKRYLAEADAQADANADDEEGEESDSAADSESEAGAKKGKRKIKAELPVKYASRSPVSIQQAHFIINMCPAQLSIFLHPILMIKAVCSHAKPARSVIL